MSRRREPDTTDSFDLLLDTVCNAFGGILFLTILLTVLLRLSHHEVDPVSTSDAARQEMIDLKTRLASVLSELETLEFSLAVQLRTRRRLVSDDMEARYTRLEQLRGSRQELERSLLKARQMAAEIQTQIDAVAARNHETDQELLQVRQRIAAGKAALNAEYKRRTQSIVPPRGRSTVKRELALVIRYGRMYSQHRWDNSRMTREPNLEEFVILGQHDGRIRVTPKPYKGLPIDSSTQFDGVLRAKLLPHDAASWYVCLVVWEDSFDSFAELKRLLVEMGYDIRILALADGECVTEGFVADPQVQ